MSKTPNRQRSRQRRSVQVPSVLRVAPLAWRSSFALSMLRGFHAELNAYRQSLLHGTILPIAEYGHSHDEFGDTTPVETIQRALLATLRTQEAEAARVGGTAGMEVYREAQFVMAALADEVLLNLDWSGREEWTDFLLEQTLFGTNYAGEMFFSRCDELLRKADARTMKLLPVYLHALALGFQGKYRESTDPRPLTTYRRKIYTAITGSESALEARHQPLSEQPYAYTIDDNDYLRLPDVRRWYLVALATLAVMLAISYGTWHNLTGEVEPLITQILHPDAAASKRSE